jgi:thiazole synthase
MVEKDFLEIGERKLSNRFFLGTGKFGSKQNMLQAIGGNSIEVVTVAMRRIDEDKNPENLIEYIPENTILMVNTSGARNADEAVKIALIAKEALGINWIKIEVINDSKYLLPDNHETIKCTKALAEQGFIVLPYMSPDLYAARELQKAGAAAVMPLGSLIGSGEGLLTRNFIKILISEIDLPIIVDAGIGVPSHAAEAMEMGASAVLANTAVSIANNPVAMAKAFSLAVQAGRLAYLSKNRRNETHATPSSPLTGFLFNDKE